MWERVCGRERESGRKSEWGERVSGREVWEREIECVGESVWERE